MKKIIVLLFVLLLAGCSSSTPAESASNESNVLKVGMECDYAPFNWTQVQDSDTAVSISSVDYADGYDVVMARRIAELIGKEV
ncbi:MAG: ABC transporter substrate-binding protein, partial [Erysipelotrichaceae bacterium]|nr:ABC transporter substrate-binding protein [Erysipelotrichaceae bacterium]